MDIAGAYAVQDANTRYWCASGREIGGFKVGLTAKAVRAVLGVEAPDAGLLFRDCHVRDSGRIPLGSLLQPRIEGEIAFILGSDIADLGATAASVADAVESVVAAIEVVDSRIADWRITAADTIADNGSSGLFVLGAARRELPDIDLAACAMTLRIDGVVAAQGAGAGTMDHPLSALAWLARHRATSSRPLRAGDVILTGALGPMIPIAPGATATVVIEGLGTASVTLDA